ncbi:MAG: histidine kinase PAS domain-containing protein histidine kinase GAF domain-containing protein [Chloroflexi bacterium]|nr:MAG: histidine kinase PAS domain-containing protein histidine kinase GAF domain-containing protein [Chloroflexota bacterium]MBA4376405.1 hypothetical protein [Anaerolinea sp.]
MTDTDQKSSKSDRLRDALRLIAIAQNQGSDVLNPDHQYLKMMKDFFGAEAIVALFVSEEKHEETIKKECTKGTDWKVSSNLPVKSGILWTSFKNNEITQVSSLADNHLYFPPVDSAAGLNNHSLTACPLMSHSIPLGSVGLINLANSVLDDHESSLLALFASKLADHLFYHKMINEVESTGDELKASKLQLLHSRNTLRTLFDNIPAAFYIVDRNYKINAINQARALRAKKLPKELVGRICHEVLFGLNSPCTGCLVEKSFQTSNPSKRTDNHRKNNSDKLEWEISIYPIIENEEKPQQVILIEQDITEKRKMEAELIQGEKLAAVGQLAAGIVHEINNPLTTVLANAQMLLQDIPPDQTDMIQSVKLIEMASIRANHVVKNILGLVRKESYDVEAFDLNESMQTALMLVSHEFLSRKISIRFDRGENMPLLMGSTNHLQGAWINLLMNAIEAIDMEKGEIKITTHYEDAKFYVEVRDSGSGITEEDLDRIFEPFFSTKNRGQATGLGLSLVRRIIQAHGGQILVESSPGEGARFTIILPEHHNVNKEEESPKYKGLL